MGFHLFFRQNSEIISRWKVQSDVLDVNTTQAFLDLSSTYNFNWVCFFCTAYIALTLHAFLYFLYISCLSDPYSYIHVFVIWSILILFSQKSISLHVVPCMVVYMPNQMRTGKNKLKQNSYLARSVNRDLVKLGGSCY